MRIHLYPPSESVGGAAPRLIRPMYPDFLHGAPPTFACAAFMKGANACKLDRKSGVRSGEHGAPVLLLRLRGWLPRLQVKDRGIPHLAKNERDMGHPALSFSQRLWG
jgi:hypothetical protein